MNLAVAALVATAMPVAAAPTNRVALPFAPPLGVDLPYETVQRRLLGKRTCSFTMVQTLRFAARGDGFLLEIVLTAEHSDAGGSTGMMFDAGMRPFVGVVTRIVVDAGGHPLDVLDLDATWAKIVASYANVSRAYAAHGGDGGLVAMMRGYFDAISNGPVAMRRERLLDNARDLLAVARPALAVGESESYRADTASPFGNAAPVATGTIRLVAATPAAAHLVIETATGRAAVAASAMTARTDTGMTPAERSTRQRAITAMRTARLSEHTDLHIARATGLLLSSTDVKYRSEGDGRRHVLARETTRLRATVS